jgi:hypothetical protein
MAFKVNYGLERAERNRAKQAKKEAKLKAKKADPAVAEPALEQAPPAVEAPPAAEE